MGQRGPAPTPTAILKLRGSWRGDLNPGAPEPDVTAPTCPDWLPEEAKAEWKRVVPLLIDQRTLAKCDLAVLADYCHAWAEFGNAVRELDKLILLNNPLQRDVRAIIKEASQRMKAAGARLGLSPADRARVQATAGEKEKPKEKGRFFIKPA
jgi:P27 family predicted phage terminase small subunit